MELLLPAQHTVPENMILVQPNWIDTYYQEDRTWMWFMGYRWGNGGGK